MYQGKEEILARLKMNGLSEGAGNEIKKGAFTYEELFYILFYLDYSIWANMRPSEYERIWRKTVTMLEN